MYLCCDLGGTTAEWAIYDPKAKIFSFRVNLKNINFEDFYEMMDHFLDQYSQLSEFGKIVNATLGMAGPTDHEEVSVTNIEGWDINITTVGSILEEHGHSNYASILNDFEALGYGLLYLFDRGFKKEDFVEGHGRFKTGPVRTGEARGTRSLICGPGTGLGLACVIDDVLKDNFPYIVTSEGGHHSLSPETVDQYRFLGGAEGFSGKRSYEEVLSRQGLVNIYNFFRREDYSAEPNYNISADDVIMLAGRANDQAATDAIELFCEFLANFCGNTALTFNCDKAIFLWGSILQKLPHELLRGRFKRHYADRCYHSEHISRLPVVLMQNEDMSLYGCAHRSEFEMRYLFDK